MKNITYINSKTSDYEHDCDIENGINEYDQSITISPDRHIVDVLDVLSNVKTLCNLSLQRKKNIIK